MNGWLGTWSTIVYRPHFLPVSSTYFRGSRIWKDWIFTASYPWNIPDPPDFHI